MSQIGKTPHLFFECGATAGEREAMMEALKEALHGVPGAAAAIDGLPAASVLARWVWLNGLLDARNEDYRLPTGPAGSAEGRDRVHQAGARGAPAVSAAAMREARWRRRGRVQAIDETEQMI